MAKLQIKQVYKKIKEAYQENILLADDYNAIVAISRLRHVIVFDRTSGNTLFELKFPFGTRSVELIRFLDFIIISAHYDSYFCVILSLNDYQTYHTNDYFPNAKEVEFLQVHKGLCFLTFDQSLPPTGDNLAVFLPEERKFVRFTYLYPEMKSLTLLRRYSDQLAFHEYKSENQLYTVDIYQLTNGSLPFANPELKSGSMTRDSILRTCFTYGNCIYVNEFSAFSIDYTPDPLLHQCDCYGNVLATFSHPQRDLHSSHKLAIKFDLIDSRDGMCIVCRCNFFTPDKSDKEHFHIYILNMDLSIKFSKILDHKDSKALYSGCAIYAANSLLMTIEEKSLISFSLSDGSIITLDHKFYDLHITSRPARDLNLSYYHRPQDKIYWHGDKNYLYFGEILES